ncbi:DUF962 domain-containing protein [Idiomarina xiamenensis]|uniref:PRS2 protein n=1 Tax=Idiomarina xiamenensis 10-D-4 TaxID=740709 RepID=K2KYC0_9GAMM|nr:Mpo1-like protein [Idiomarina xiamenensis]EKE87564.1 hypothetical protein A10D4_00680 [Idiomarina xiamenensis 10-D-4]
MKSLTEHLSNYACYHRDSRNILTHMFGIPMIVVAIVILLSRPTFSLLGLPLTPALLLSIAAVIFYFRLSKLFAAVMAFLLLLCLIVGEQIAMQSTAQWLITGIGLFVVGWIFQFIGHYYEGRKPAFVDDIIGLLIGPLFVVAEVLFALGLCSSLQQAIEQRVAQQMAPPKP